jgi:drug/metabolite transporter (DMT)-like permease
LTALQRPERGLGRSLLPIAALTLIWGSNWPVLKLGVAEVPPFTFRSYTLVFAGLGLLAIAKASGESIRIPKSDWWMVVVLAAFNIFGWNALVLFGIREMPAGRSAILAYTMPVWATLVSLFVLHERLSGRKVLGLALGMAGMAVLLWDDMSAIEKSPFGALMILGAAVVWGIGTVLLRKFKPALPQTTLSGWMMIVGWLPFALLGPLTDPQWIVRPATLSGSAWFAIFFNVFFAGTLAHWAWFTLARTLPVAVSSLSSLPVPVVGVFAGIVVLGERPGPAEWIALTLVLLALVAVLLPPLGRKSAAAGTIAEPEP